MRSGISRAHSHWLAERIAQCTWSGQCNTDWYGLVRTGTDMAQNVCVPCAFEFPEHMALTTPCAPRSVLFRTHPYLSVRHCSQYRLCAMCPASQQTTQPCAFEISQHMAHTAPSANRPTSPTSPTSPTFFAHSIGSASVFASQRRGKLFALPAQSPFFLLKKTLPDL